jgi:26S proteasome regulatory subunit N11
MMAQLQGGGGGGGADAPKLDTAETVHISSLALLKMLKHGACARALGCMCDRVRGRAQGAPACPWR